MNPLPRLIAPEVPLASGVTFRELLGRLYGDTLFTDQRDRPLAQNYAWRRLKSLLSGDYRTLPDGIRCVSGHFKARKYDGWGRDTIKAIWFRDPVDRVAAHYSRWKESPDMDNIWCRKLLDEELTLEEFGRLPVMRNVFAKFLDGARISTFDFIGVAEAYGLSLQLFRVLLGAHAWPKVGLQMINEPVDYDDARGWRTRRQDVAPDVRAVLERCNRKDYEIYRQAYARFQELCTRHNVRQAEKDLFAKPDLSRDLLIFVHVPKTAGTTFRALLQRVYGEENVLFDNTNVEWIPLAENTRCVGGHFPSTRFRMRFPRARYATWLRDPVQRMVSSYDFNQRNSHPHDALWRRMREMNLSLPDYAAEPLARNEQFRMLREKPLEEMEFVGITEEYERGVELFRRVFGLCEIPPTPNLNINPRKHVHDSYVLAPDIRRRIENSNSLDVDLYLCAKRRFDELCAKHGV